jgi:hypothetical protein
VDRPIIIHMRSCINYENSVNRDALLEAFAAFAAELTVAAYRVALRTSKQGTWLDLELDLWRALADTAKTWREGIASAPIDGDAARTLQRR